MASLAFLSPDVEMQQMDMMVEEQEEMQGEEEMGEREVEGAGKSALEFGESLALPVCCTGASTD